MFHSDNFRYFDEYKSRRRTGEGEHDGAGKRLGGAEQAAGGDPLPGAEAQPRALRGQVGRLAALHPQHVAARPVLLCVSLLFLLFILKIYTTINCYYDYYFCYYFYYFYNTNNYYGVALGPQTLVISSQCSKIAV